MFQYQMKQNHICMTGEIVSQLRCSNQVDGEYFYEADVLVQRLSGQADVLPVVLSERQIREEEDYRGACVFIAGSLRSYFYTAQRKNHLRVYVFASDIVFLDRQRNEITTNDLHLEGKIIRKPLFRTTPGGREITEFILVVTRDNGKDDYVPCICWGRNARFMKRAEEGTTISLDGRFQSREYVKWKSGTCKTNHTTYEVSVSRLI